VPAIAEWRSLFVEQVERKYGVDDARWESEASAVLDAKVRNLEDQRHDQEAKYPEFRPLVHRETSPQIADGDAAGRHQNTLWPMDISVARQDHDGYERGCDEQKRFESVGMHEIEMEHQYEDEQEVGIAIEDDKTQPEADADQGGKSRHGYAGLEREGTFAHFHKAAGE
jgi:hypothetical protein